MKTLKALLKGIKAGMADFGSAINTLVTSIVLVAVYLVGVGITSMLAKAFSKKFLSTTIDPTAATYWRARPPASNDINDYYRQF